MSNENEIKSNKKYIILAFVVILGAIGIMFSNSNKEETETTTVATTEQVSVVEEPTIARIQFTTTLVNANEPQLEVYVDDSETPLQQVNWMPPLGKQGYMVEKNNGTSDVTIKVLNDADINIELKGYKDGTDQNLIPHWVKYTVFTINDIPVIEEPIINWYGKPFKYTLNAKAGETYKFHFEWTKADK